MCSTLYRKPGGQTHTLCIKQDTGGGGQFTPAHLSQPHSIEYTHVACFPRTTSRVICFRSYKKKLHGRTIGIILVWRHKIVDLRNIICTGTHNISSETHIIPSETNNLSSETIIFHFRSTIFRRRPKFIIGDPQYFI